MNITTKEVLKMIEKLTPMGEGPVYVRKGDSGWQEYEMKREKWRREYFDPSETIAQYIQNAPKEVMLSEIVVTKMAEYISECLCMGANVQSMQRFTSADGKFSTEVWDAVMHHSKVTSVAKQAIIAGIQNLYPCAESFSHSVLKTFYFYEMDVAEALGNDAEICQEFAKHWVKVYESTFISGKDSYGYTAEEIILDPIRYFFGRTSDVPVCKFVTSFFEALSVEGNRRFKEIVLAISNKDEYCALFRYCGKNRYNDYMSVLSVYKNTL
jgi:hypothetical protein